jgi:hypothetical protein
MPIEYERNDARELVVATGSGSFHIADVVALFERMREDRTWTYAVILDIRRLAGRPTVDDLRLFADIAARPDVQQQPRGPLAIVASDSTMYGMACAYASMARGRRIEVFRDRGEAERWLTAHHRPR